MDKSKQIKWINCAKFVAIFAVMIDHTGGILYDNQSIKIGSYFSVSLFILISGMLCYSSNKRNDLDYVHTVLKSCKKIVISYLIATFICQIVTFHFFDFGDYMHYVVNFNLMGHFYYVLLYIQLMLVNKVLFCIIESVPDAYELPIEVGVGMLILCLSALTTNYTDILGVYGGGGKLLGGTYLFLFYLGMLLMKHNIFEKCNLKKSLLVFALFSILLIVWWRFECYNSFNVDKCFPFGNGINPPSITLLIMAVIMLFWSYGFFTLMQYNRMTCLITEYISKLGRHTLYIFLYHMLFLDVVLVRHVSINNMTEKRVIYLGTMILAPIVLELCLNFIRKNLFFKEI